MLPGLAVDDLVSSGVVDLVGLSEIQIHFVAAVKRLAISLVSKEFAHLADVLLSQLCPAVIFATAIGPANCPARLLAPELRLRGSLDVNLRRRVRQSQLLIRVRQRNSDDNLIAIPRCGDGQLVIFNLAGRLIFRRQIQELNRLELKGIHGCSVRMCVPALADA